MKILVTGATGYIGQYIVNLLLQKSDCNIIIACRSNNLPASWINKNRITVLPFDFEKMDVSIDYFNYFLCPDLCIHLAWQGLPNYKESFHIETVLPQQYHFLNNLVSNGLQRLTVTGTCFEYGMQQGCLSETMEALPNNAYAIAKHRLYLSLVQLQAQIPFSFNWIRLFYMYGHGQNPKALFSQLVAAIERGDAEFNMSGGEQERDFLPVETVAENIVEIALASQAVGLVNCCSGTPITIKDWVTNYLKQQNATLKLNLGFYPYADYEPMSFWGDAKKILGFLANKI